MSFPKRTYSRGTAVTTGDVVIVGRHEYYVFHHLHAWRPPADVYERDGVLYVVVEVAGMSGGQFQISLTSTVLTVTGGRVADGLRDAAYHQLEIPTGEFRLDITLPWPVDEAALKADYDDGFLTIRLPRR